MNTKNTPHKWLLLVYFISKHVTIIVKFFPSINFLLSQIKFHEVKLYLLVVSNMLVSFAAPLNTTPSLRSSERQRIFLQRRWQGGQSEFWCSRRRRCERTDTRALWNGRKTRFYWSARTESASLHVISEIFLLLQCAAAGSARCMKPTLWSSADHALAQVSVHVHVTMSNFYSHTLKNGCILFAV